MSKPMKLHYDERRGIATITEPDGHRTRFKGSREGAERYFNGLQRERDSRGILRRIVSLDGLAAKAPR